jgi:hypothetical protein
MEKKRQKERGKRGAKNSHYRPNAMRVEPHSARAGYSKRDTVFCPIPATRLETDAVFG